MKEIRWHARAGQGAKTAAQLLAVALLREGKSVQAFPEYGPERRGAPMRAYTRYDDRPIRRHDAVEEPDAVVVLEPSLVASRTSPTDCARWHPLVNSRRTRPGALVLPARPHRPSRVVNLVMLGALAAVLGEPALDSLAEAAVEALGRKADAGRAARRPRGGYAAAKEERWAA